MKLKIFLYRKQEKKPMFPAVIRMTHNAKKKNNMAICNILQSRKVKVVD